MEFRKRVAQLDLTVVLLVAVVIELALNRLAVPVLRPPGSRTPPLWHRNLDTLGLFAFHLASVLALGVVLWKSFMLTMKRETFLGAARVSIGGVSVLFVILAAARVLLRSEHHLVFALESSFTGLLLLLTLALAVRQAEARVKLGLFVLCVPFFIHYYGTFTLRMLVAGDQAQWSSLPDKVRDLGTWSLAIAGLLSPFLFAPRPWRVTVSRPGPMALTAFIATITAVILRRQPDVGMEIASRGLGVEIPPGAPVGTLAIYVVAMAALAWTITATLTADSPARRLIGVGISLIVTSGYAFVWPLQFLAAAAGALAIAEGGAQVAREEDSAAAADRRFQAPPIAAEAWTHYLGALTRALGCGAPVTTREGSIEVSRLTGRRADLPYEVAIARQADAVTSIEVTFGPPPESDPAWTLAARPSGLLATGQHPPPPRTSAPPLAKTGDETFDRRFRIHGTEKQTAALLDDGLRAAAAAVLDGWLAVWPGRTLRYHVCPGRGAPLDHPIPVTELAFRAPGEPERADKLATVVKLLGELAERATKR